MAVIHARVRNTKVHQLQVEVGYSKAAVQLPLRTDGEYAWATKAFFSTGRYTGEPLRIARNTWRVKDRTGGGQNNIARVTKNGPFSQSSMYITYKPKLDSEGYNDGWVEGTWCVRPSTRRYWLYDDHGFHEFSVTPFVPYGSGARGLDTGTTEHSVDVDAFRAILSQCRKDRFFQPLIDWLCEQYDWLNDLFVKPCPVYRNAAHAIKESREYSDKHNRSIEEYNEWWENNRG